jgi:hypothetical protein
MIGVLPVQGITDGMQGTIDTRRLQALRDEAGSLLADARAGVLPGGPVPPRDGETSTNPGLTRLTAAQLLAAGAQKPGRQGSVRALHMAEAHLRALVRWFNESRRVN